MTHERAWSIATRVANLEGPRITARGVHRFASALFVPAVALLAIASIGLFLVRRRRVLVAIPLVAGGLAIVAAITGNLLPWDQLSLWAVTVGTKVRGYTPILRNHQVKYVLFGSQMASTETVSQWFWLHAVVVPLVIVGVLVALVLTTRRASKVTVAPDD